MRLQVKSWGNSKAIRLPKDFTQTMNLETGDFLELAKIDDQTIKLVVVPNKAKQKRLTLAERIAMTAFDTLPVCAEWDSMESIGGEI
ncbi:AbrB/MazE/SpoVT family DNA-binding domain-containing protein [Lonepinella sp. MS14436]|uniref:AbrB/MazE/SpoVT family DNA-binding domain-containing protein n=1 Tax=Lonepinella sp. MS14436 TaxID=3003619 RepID=UPI0036D81188